MSATIQMIVRDTFTRANAGSLGSNWSSISDAQDGTVFGINSNAAQPVATATRATSFWNANSFANDQFSEAIANVSATGTNSHLCGVVVRASAGGYYLFTWDALNTGAVIQVAKVIGGTFTNLQNTTNSFAVSGCLMRLEVVGTTLRAYVNGNLVITVTDSSIPSGAPGITGYMAATSPTANMTNWVGGDLIWTRQGTVIAAGTTGGTEEPTVIYEANPHILSANPDGCIFKMWYTNGWAPQVTYPLVINYAESNDGITWTQYSGNPVISNGATPVAHGYVVHQGNTYYGYYGNSSAASLALDLWTSSDGLSWTLSHPSILPVGAAGTWDSISVDNPNVWIEGSTWYMIYTAISIGESSGGPYSVGLATSPDGITWTKYAGNPVIGPGFTQSASYGFTTIENPLSDGGQFTAAGSGQPLPKVIAGNLCEATAISTTQGAYYTGIASWPANQYSEIKVAALVNSGSVIGLAVRMSGAARTDYQLNVHGPTGSGSVFCQLYAQVAGVANLMASFALASVNVGDVIRLAVGTMTRSGDNALYVYQNGVQVFAWDDNTYAASITAGTPGFVVFAGTAITDAQLNNWAGGSADLNNKTEGKVIQKINGLYYLWGFMSPDNVANNLPSDITVWKSSDLHTWIISSKSPVYERVLVDEGANLSSGQVADPCMVYVNNQTYLYYDTIDVQSANHIHINLATAPYTIAQLSQLAMGDIVPVTTSVTGASTWNGTQTAFDNFPGVTLNPSWIAIQTRTLFQASNGVAQPVTANNSVSYAGIWNDAFSPDQFVEVQLAPSYVANSGFINLELRNQGFLTGPGAGYFIQMNGATIWLYRADTFALLTSVSFVLSAGMIIRADACGYNVTVAVNNQIVLSWMDNSQARAGRPGIQLQASTGQSVGVSAITNFRAGNMLPTAVDGVWVKQGIALLPTTSDLSAGSGGLPGTQNQTVLYEGNSQLSSGTVFKMWFGGGSGIYYAESQDGINWTRYPTVVISGKSLPRIFKNGSTYYLFVSSAPMAWTSVDQYTSADGVNWTLAHAGVLGVGGVGTWDSNFCGYFQVVDIVAGTWRAIYSGQNASGAVAQGLATSPDGVTWTKYASNPVIPSTMRMAGVVDVHNINGVYYGWANVYTPGGGPISGIGRIQSADLITWTNKVMSLMPDNAWEGLDVSTGEVAIASLVEVNGQTYMYYSATPNDGVFTTAFQISVAVASKTLAQLVAGQEYFVNSSQQFADTFQQADGLLDGGWIMPITGKLQVASHFLEPATLTVDCVGVYPSGFFSPSQQYAEVVIHFLSASDIAPVVLGSTIQETFYEAFFSGSTNQSIAVRIYRMTNLVEVQVGPVFTFTPQVGDVIRLSVATSILGPVLSIYQNGMLILQTIDTSSSALASGYPGVRMNASGGLGNSQISSFAAGSTVLVPSSGTIPSHGAAREGAGVAPPPAVIGAVFGGFRGGG